MRNVHAASPDHALGDGTITRAQPMQPATYKRRSYISSPETQQRIIRQFMLILGVGIILGLANAYVIASFSHVDIVVLPDASPLETSLAVLYMASLAMASLGVMLLLAVFYSHRIGGPVFKIVGALQRMADGDLRGRVRLRDTDLLDDVALAVNEVGMSLGRALREIDESVAGLRDNRHLDESARQRVAAIDAVLRRYAAVLPSCQTQVAAPAEHSDAMSLKRIPD